MTTVWIYPPRDQTRKSYVALWACACPLPALHPFTSTTATHTLECTACQKHETIELATAIDVPNRFGIAPLTIRCSQPACGITTQIWHPLAKGTQVRISCAKCGTFAATVMG